MVKSELIETLAARMGETSTQSEKWLRNFVALIYDELANDRIVKISGFGEFSVSHREARIGVNPRQPEQKITIPKLNTPKFKAGEAFKQAVAIK